MDDVLVICRNFFDASNSEPSVLVAKDDGLVFDQIDDAAERIFLAERISESATGFA